MRTMWSSKTYLQGINRSSDDVVEAASNELNKFLATGLQCFKIRFS